MVPAGVATTRRDADMFRRKQRNGGKRREKKKIEKVSSKFVFLPSLPHTTDRTRTCSKLSSSLLPRNSNGARSGTSPLYGRRRRRAVLLEDDGSGGTAANGRSSFFNTTLPHRRIADASALFSLSFSRRGLCCCCRFIRIVVSISIFSAFSALAAVESGTRHLRPGDV